TELGLLISDDDSPLPLYDTAALHAKSAVEQALD
ncbi:MAG TPA: aspartate/glutamate racemase, partial [Sulfitobacter sp.]|nr:aspartate/glutamate racemase [Sulfitobacter sp.]